MYPILWHDGLVHIIEIYSNYACKSLTRDSSTRKHSSDSHSSELTISLLSLLLLSLAVAICKIVLLCCLDDLSFVLVDSLEERLDAPKWVNTCDLDDVGCLFGRKNGAAECMDVAADDVDFIVDSMAPPPLLVVESKLVFTIAAAVCRPAGLHADVDAVTPTERLVLSWLVLDRKSKPPLE